jgi:hypothetical protein
MGSVLAVAAACGAQAQIPHDGLTCGRGPWISAAARSMQHAVAPTGLTAQPGGPLLGGERCSALHASRPAAEDGSVRALCISTDRCMQSALRSSAALPGSRRACAQQAAVPSYLPTGRACRGLMLRAALGRLLHPNYSEQLEQVRADPCGTCACSPAGGRPAHGSAAGAGGGGVPERPVSQKCSRQGRIGSGGHCRIHRCRC